MEPGTWIRTTYTNALGFRYDHDGIVVAIPTDDEPPTPTNVQVVHFVKIKRRGIIAQTTLETFMCDGLQPRIVRPSYNALTFTPDEVVRRAKSQIGAARYKVWGRNCQHFAHWCVCGCGLSHNMFKYGAFGAGIGVGMALVGLCAAIHSRSF